MLVYQRVSEGTRFLVFITTLERSVKFRDTFQQPLYHRWEYIRNENIMGTHNNQQELYTAVFKSHVA